MSFNPNDSSEILITGNEFFEKYSLNKNSFSRMNSSLFQRYETMNILGHLWMDLFVILLVTNQGDVYSINQHGEIIHKWKIDFRFSSIDHVNLLLVSRGLFIATKFV